MRSPDAEVPEELATVRGLPGNAHGTIRVAAAGVPDAVVADQPVALC
jgi:hypothetical protein